MNNKKRTRICEATQPYLWAYEYGCIGLRMRVRESMRHVSLIIKVLNLMQDMQAYPNLLICSI